MVKTRPVSVWYGGSFDPPHLGHQKIVDHLVTLEYIERVIVTPAYLNPFKKSTLAPAEKRLQWCQKIFDHPKVTVDDSEVKSGHSVYTFDTISKLEKIYDIRYIAIGSDNLEAIDKWYNFDQLNQKITWLVFERSGYSGGYDKLMKYESFTLDEPVSSSKIREDMSTVKIDKKIIQDVKKYLTKENK